MKDEKNTDGPMVKVIAKIAGNVHKKVRVAALPPEFGREAENFIACLIGAQAGFWSAGLSTLEDLQSNDLISKEDFDLLYPLALELCKKAQVAVQRQLLKDLRDSGAPIPSGAEDDDSDLLTYFGDTDKLERIH
jgi:hypothetical protein